MTPTLAPSQRARARWISWNSPRAPASPMSIASTNPAVTPARWAPSPEAVVDAGTATLWVIERSLVGRSFYERGGWALDGSRRDAVWGPEVRYAKALAPA